MSWANRYGEIAVEMTNEIFIHFQISLKSVTNNMRNVAYNRKNLAPLKSHPSPNFTVFDGLVTKSIVILNLSSII